MHSQKKIYLLFIMILAFVLIFGCESSYPKYIREPIITPTTLTVVTKEIPVETKNIPTQTKQWVNPLLYEMYTPMPTLSPEEALRFTMDLYENNNCDLPCWWGVIPGKTDWRDAWQFLRQFTTNNQPWQLAFHENKSSPNYYIFKAYLNVPKSTNQEHYFTLNDLYFKINKETFKVDYIHVNTGNIDAYIIPNILNKYGMPQEVYIDPAWSQLEYYNGISILLYYPQYGFLSSHFTTVGNDDWTKPQITACFQKYTELSIWPQERQIDIQKLATLGISSVSEITIKYLKPLEKVSDFTIAKFYATFSNNNLQPCIQFNTELLLK